MFDGLALVIGYIVLAAIGLTGAIFLMEGISAIITGLIPPLRNYKTTTGFGGGAALMFLLYFKTGAAWGITIGLVLASLALIAFSDEKFGWSKPSPPNSQKRGPRHVRK